MAVVVKASGLRPPALITATQYSARVKAEAIIRLGYFKAIRKSKTMFKKSIENQGEVKIKAMEYALQRMKRETVRSVVFQLKDYRENLKFRYFFKLVETVSESFTQTVLERFQAYFSDLSATIERIGTRQSDKEKARQVLDDMERAARELGDKLNRIRGEIEKTS
jgi:hypothetical protein